PTATGTADPSSGIPVVSGTCGLSAPAFCADFSAGPQAGGRSGDLDPRQWSVARIEAPYQYMGGNSTQSFEEFPSVPVAPCRTGVGAIEPDSDSLVCNGQLMTASGAQNYGLISYRPTQPFDFTNRTGKIVFNVDAATGGGLDKWISLFVTDQPTAGANNLNQVTGLQPRNGVGLNLDLSCGSPYARVGVGNIFSYANYLESVPYQGTNSGPCVATAGGALNHFEIDLSQSRIQVWGTDHSTDGGKSFPAAVLLASAPLALYFGTGYVHYQVGIRAPAKYLQEFNLNAPYALYHWAGMGFDGPVVSADRVYQVPDALTRGPNGGQTVGYQLVDGTSGTPQGMYTCCALTKVAPFSLPNVTLTGATSAHLTLDAYATQADSFNAGTLAIRYRLNGGPWRDPSPVPPYATLVGQACPGCPGGGSSENWWMALDLPVALSDLQPGTNTVEFTSANASQAFPLILSNADLLVSTSG